MLRNQYVVVRDDVVCPIKTMLCQRHSSDTETIVRISLSLDIYICIYISLSLDIYIYIYIILDIEILTACHIVYLESVESCEWLKNLHPRQYTQLASSPLTSSKKRFTILRIEKKSFTISLQVQNIEIDV